MRLFLSRRHLVYNLAAAALLAAGLVLCGCQDVVRRLDDKYRPVVPEPVRSATIVTDSIDSSGVPVRLVNLEVEDLELVARDAGSGEVPFTPTLEADEQHDGLAYIRTPPNGKPIKDFSVTVSLCSKADGTEYASHTFTADRYPYRHYEVADKTYKFELVKMFHCDNDGNLGIGSSPALFTSRDNGEAVAKDSIISVKDSGGDTGTKITFFHDSFEFVQGSYDYFEIKFRSESGVESTITLHGSNSFLFVYDSGVLTASGGSGLTDDKLTYNDSSADWVTLGFWNSASDNNCLFVEDYSATSGTANAETLSNVSNYTYITVDAGEDTTSTTEIDYIAFFKKVE